MTKDDHLMNTRLCLYCQEIPGLQGHGCLACNIANNDSSIFREDSSISQTDTHHLFGSLAQINAPSLTPSVSSQQNLPQKLYNTTTPSFTESYLQVASKTNNILFSLNDFHRLENWADLAVNSPTIFEQERNNMEKFFMDKNEYIPNTYFQTLTSNNFQQMGSDLPSDLQPYYFQKSNFQDPYIQRIDQSLNPEWKLNITQNERYPLPINTAFPSSYPGLAMEPNSISTFGVGTVGGNFWYFQPDEVGQAGQHFLWLVSPLNQNIYPPGDSVRSGVPPFPLAGSWLRLFRRLIQWKTKGFQIHHVFGGAALRGTIIPVFLTNWHNIAPLDELTNHQTAVGKKANILDSSQNQKNWITVGTVVRDSVPLTSGSGGNERGKINQSRPDAAMSQTGL